MICLIFQKMKTHSPQFQCHISLASEWHFFACSPCSNFPLSFFNFLKQGKCFSVLKPAANSNCYDFLRNGQLQVWSIGWLNFQSFKRFFSPRLLQQTAMITIEHDIVVGDILLWLRGNLYDSFGSIGNVHHACDLCFRLLGESCQRACRHPGRK